MTMQGARFGLWRKSRHSSGGDSCVEVGFSASGTIGVRNSKEQGFGPVVEFTTDEWLAFIRSVKEGEFDLP